MSYEGGKSNWLLFHVTDDLQKATKQAEKLKEEGYRVKIEAKDGKYNVMGKFMHKSFHTPQHPDV